MQVLSAHDAEHQLSSPIDTAGAQPVVMGKHTQSVLKDLPIEESERLKATEAGTLLSTAIGSGSNE